MNITSQVEVKNKNEIIICDAQFKEIKWLFSQYDIEKPGWLRRKFRINQRRRKCLNDVIGEAQLDRIYCDTECLNGDWSMQIHHIWHDINGVIRCL